MSQRRHVCGGCPICCETSTMLEVAARHAISRGALDMRAVIELAYVRAYAVGTSEIPSVFESKLCDSCKEGLKMERHAETGSKIADDIMAAVAKMGADE